MRHRFDLDSSVPLVSVLSLGLWLLTLAVTTFGQAAPPTAAAKTVNDGVYSAAQAQRGQAVFEESCSTCHDPARFTGDEFLNAWVGKPLQEFFVLVSTTMPEDNPGGLKPQQYFDVVAYVLKLNQFPAGPEELKGSAEGMRAVKIDKKGR